MAGNTGCPALSSPPRPMGFLFQCLGQSAEVGLEVRRILLTGSGGPFLDRPLSELAAVAPAALAVHFDAVAPALAAPLAAFAALATAVAVQGTGEVAMRPRHTVRSMRPQTPATSIRRTRRVWAAQVVSLEHSLDATAASTTTTTAV